MNLPFSNWLILSTYALALSKNGRLAEAVAAQEKVVARASANERMESGMTKRLEALKESLEKDAQP